MYSKIKELQKKGFSIRKSAKYLRISRQTVSKYYGMSLDEYREQAETIRRLSSLAEYEAIVLDWLYTYPDMTAAQVYDWLLEHYNPKVSERTVSRYVKQLREEHGISKVTRPREYEAVEELPMGHQMQLDFGVRNMPLSDRSGHRKVYFVAIVLSHSRYKWGYFQDKPFTTLDLISAMDDCFEFLGGYAREIVVDQDAILTVSENYGDIIYTHEFEKYKTRHNLNIRVCRKADPESKGQVENVVKFIKNNFLPHRFFMEPELLNQCFLAWLERTGNRKVHGTTKKVPAKVFEFEREHLKPVLSADQNNCTHSITRNVRKDNTIWFESNRYSLPLGTYTKEREVEIKIADDKLQIWQCFGDYMIAEHLLCSGRGKLIKNSDHCRNKEESIDGLQHKVLEKLDPCYLPYLLEIRMRKSRYYRDQLQLLTELIRSYGAERVEDALLRCMHLELYSITDVKSVCEHQSAEETPASFELFDTGNMPTISNPQMMEIITEKRDLGVYDQVGGGCHE